MEGIRVSIDNQKFQSKPAKESAVLSNRIARAPKLLKPDEIRDFAFQVGCDGCTFSPATFKNGKRNKDNFEQQQLFALDFDNKGPKKKLTFEEVKSRADSYELPVLFAYDTFSSTGHDKFRVVFLNDASITDRKAAEAVQLALGRMFPEADESCYRDVSRMYYGGKEVLYYDDKIPVTNIESVFRNFTYCMKNKYKPNHYGRKLSEFSEETGISLNKKGFLDVTVSDCLPAADNPTETHGCFLPVPQYP